MQNHYNIDEDEKAIIYQEKSNEKKNDSVNWNIPSMHMEYLFLAIICIFLKSILYVKNQNWLIDIHYFANIGN